MDNGITPGGSHFFFFLKNRIFLRFRSCSVRCERIDRREGQKAEREIPNLANGDRPASLWRPLTLLSKSLAEQPEIEMKVLDFETPGGPEVIYVREVANPKIKDEEVLIEIVAIGVSFEDIWRRQGHYAFRAGLYPFMGHECSGKIVAMGSNASRFKIGDEVCAILVGGGGYAELVAVHESLVLPIPLGISLLDAAALPQATCLTLYVFTVLRQLCEGKKILIHGAAGGVGIIALQYARHMGCEVFAVAGTSEKIETCKNLGANICINYKKENFCKRVMTATAGKGVDIIIDVNGQNHFQKNLDCLAVHGTLIILGILGGNEVDLGVSLLKEKDIEITGANLRSLHAEYIKELWRNAETEIWPLINNGYVKPVVAGVFRFSEAADAHRLLENGRAAAGKVILSPKEP